MWWYESAPLVLSCGDDKLRDTVRMPAFVLSRRTGNNRLIQLMTRHSTRPLSHPQNVPPKADEPQQESVLRRAPGPSLRRQDSACCGADPRRAGNCARFTRRVRSASGSSNWSDAICRSPFFPWILRILAELMPLGTILPRAREDASAHVIIDGILGSDAV